MQSVYRSTGMQLVESSMTMAAMATVNNTTIDNLQFQQQFENFFNMMLQMEEVLLADYATTQTQLARALEQMGRP